VGVSRDLCGLLITARNVRRSQLDYKMLTPVAMLRERPSQHEVNNAARALGVEHFRRRFTG
jgi:hypothetical protein